MIAGCRRDIVGKMYRSGIISWIKYAVVREDTANDDYLRDVLASSAQRDIVVSELVSSSAIIHMRDFEIGSFTSGCVCVNPRRSMDMLAAIQRSDYAAASETIREQFCGFGRSSQRDSANTRFASRSRTC